MSFNNLKKWQQEALKTISAAEKRGESKSKAAESIAQRYADDISAKDKHRAVRDFYVRNKDKYVIPVENTEGVEPWKVEVVRQMQVMPLNAQKRTDWVAIAEEVSKQYPSVFKNCLEPKEKIRKWVRNNAALVESIKSELSATKVAASHKGLPTTAHINDDDVDAPVEEEVMPATQSRIVKMDIDQKTQQVVAELDFLIGRGDEKKLNDEKYILEVLGYDPEFFELVSMSVREGTWGCQKKGGEEGLLSSRRVMANIKPRKDSVCVEALAERFNEMVAEHTPRTIKKRVVNGKNIAIVSIADLHLGKLAWKPETGENYDHNIARERFYFIIDQAITRMKAYESISPDEKIEEIIFFWSQDFFHFDTVDTTTTAGTRQDTDVRWQKLFYMGCEMLVNAIESLQTVAPVRTFYTRSNHDTMTSFYAMLYLSAYFKDNGNVEVETGPSGRKYIKYGVNLLGFGHGDKEGKRVASVMALEAPAEWGTTFSREFFLGHFHSRQTERDENGVVVRYLASPTSTDAWHYECGYLGAQKQAQLFIRNKLIGPVAEYPIPIPFDPN